MEIVFDLGGTNLRVAEAIDGGLGEIRKVKTPLDPYECVKALITMSREIAGETAITSIVGGVAGVVKEGVIFWEPNLPGQWEHFELGPILKHELHAPSFIVNDSALVALGEAHKGAGQGSEIMMYVTVSTGVGGARIVHGVIDEATYGFEIGHQIVNGAELEQLVSGTAVSKKYGINPWELDDLNARNELADILAIGLYNTILAWSPDTVVLGGSMITGKNPIPIDRVSAAVAQKLVMFPKPPVVKMAQLKDEGGLYGAAIYTQRALGGSR